MPRSSVKILDTAVFGIPWSASSSHTVSGLRWLKPVHIQQSQVFCLLQAFQNVGHSHRFSTFFEAFVPHLYLGCTHCIVTESLLNHPNSFCGGMFKLKARFDADLLPYSLILNATATQYTRSFNGVYHRPPLTRAVTVSLFTHAHSSPLSLAARVHRCCAKSSHCINNGQTFSGQTSLYYWKLWFY